MTKCLSEMTLKEVKEMCSKTRCKDCDFVSKDYKCKIICAPSNWELKENGV